MSNWTQPICGICWDKKYPNKLPIRLLSPEKERCVFCGNNTFSGIYVRVDPKTITPKPFPDPVGTPLVYPGESNMTAVRFPEWDRAVMYMNLDNALWSAGKILNQRAKFGGFR